jgi:hypothetical protein
MRYLIALMVIALTGCGQGFTPTGGHRVAGQALFIKASHTYCGHTVLATDLGALIRFEDWSATDPQSGYRRLDDTWAIAEGIGLVSRDDVTCGFRIADVT